MDQHAFVRSLAAIFEKSPWVAEKAWEARPFSSIDDLHAKMVRSSNTPISTRNSLCCALTPISPEGGAGGRHDSLLCRRAGERRAQCAEQAGAGTLSRYNAEYKKKFGFPFMIAVRNHTKEGIFAIFKQRLSNDTVTELGNALQQVYNITRLGSTSCSEACEPRPAFRAAEQDRARDPGPDPRPRGRSHGDGEGGCQVMRPSPTTFRKSRNRSAVPNPQAPLTRRAVAIAPG